MDEIKKGYFLGVNETILFVSFEDKITNYIIKKKENTSILEEVLI